MATSITRKGDTYSVPAALVHRLIWAIFASLIALAGYMVVWNRDDLAWKRAMESRIEDHAGELAVHQRILSQGVLPRADERLKRLEHHLSDDHP